ncbi:MAG: hypothetical protein QNL61_10690 [Crocinitomicaceae bacterium]
MQEQLTVFSFDVISPPIAIGYLDGIMEGETCSKHPMFIEAQTPEEAPIKLS